jgi:hypothetical protein
MKTARRVAAAVALLFFPGGLLSAQPASARHEFYVSPTGDDSNRGTMEAPWRTIQHAADTATAGCTVNVRGGTYTERVTINASGNSRDGFVTFRSYPGETAVLDGGRFTPDGRSGMFVIPSKSYIRIQGFEIRNYRTNERSRTPMGISVTGAGSHIELLNNNVHHIEQTFSERDAPGRGGNGFGIAVYGTDAKTPIANLVIDGNEVHHLQTGSSESLVVNGNVTNFRITHNVVHDNNNIGIDIIGAERTAPDPAVDQARDGLVSGNLVYNITSKGNPAYGNEQNSDGIYVDGGTRILIERNVLHHVDFGIELASEHLGRTTSYVTARNNLIYACNTAGISIGGYDEKRGSTEHCTLVNNTLFGNDTANTGSGEFQMQFKMKNNVFENNIVFAGTRCLMTASKSGRVDETTPTVSMDHNLYYCAAGAEASKWGWYPASYSGFAGYVKASGMDQHSRFADPRFVDPSKNDFHLQTDSPAIDAGTNAGSPVGEQDLDGRARMNGSKIDGGCYQKQQE